MTVRDAATVLLLRDGEDGLEVFLIRRAPGMAFASGMHAFPGGSVEPTDGGWAGALPDGWAALLAEGDTDLARKLVGAAVRETLEECGVWLAEGDRPTVPARGEPALDLAGIALRTELLRPWSHWLTPAFEPRRFDTRFLVAALPADADPRHVGGEADDGRWVRPADVEGLPMLPPTFITLAELAPFATVAQVMAAPRTISRIMPVVAGEGDRLRLLFPWDEGYQEAR